MKADYQGQEYRLKANILGRLRGYGELLSLIRRYGSSHVGMLSLFVLLAVFGTLTESFGVFLLVPLLQTMGQSNIFSNVPLLGSISAVFDALPADTRSWASGVAV